MLFLELFFGQKQEPAVNRLSTKRHSRPTLELPDQVRVGPLYKARSCKKNNSAGWSSKSGYFLNFIPVLFVVTSVQIRSCMTQCLLNTIIHVIPIQGHFQSTDLNQTATRGAMAIEGNKISRFHLLGKYSASPSALANFPSHVFLQGKHGLWLNHLDSSWNARERKKWKGVEGKAEILSQAHQNEFL